jgi:DNA repair exonuclease SbcCD ATPase subunit
MGEEPVPTDLRQVASAFVDIQEARHEADYDLSRKFSRSEVRDLIEVSEKATGAWRNIRTTSEAQVFLTALLVNESVSKS